MNDPQNTRFIPDSTAVDIDVCRQWKPMLLWQDEHGGSLFHSKNTLDWFIKAHKERLVSEGVLIVGKGRTPTMLGPRFGQVAIAILVEETQATLEEKTAA